MADMFKLAKEISDIFVREKLSAREMLMLLRLIESDATVVLVLSQLAEQSVEEEIKEQ